MEQIVEIIEEKMKIVTKLEGKFWINRFPANLIMLQDLLKYNQNTKVEEYTKKLIRIIESEINKISILEKNIIKLNQENTDILSGQVDSLIRALERENYRIKVFKRIREIKSISNYEKQDLCIEHFLSYLLTIKNINFDDLHHAITAYKKDAKKGDFLDFIYEFCKKEKNYKVLIPFNIENHNGYKEENVLNDLMNANKNKEIIFYYDSNIKSKMRFQDIVKSKSINKVESFLANDYRFYACINIKSEGTSAALKSAREMLSKYEALLFKNNKAMLFNKETLLLKKEYNKHTQESKYFASKAKTKAKKHFHYKKTFNSLRIDMVRINNENSEFSKKIDNIVRSNYQKSSNPWFTTELAINYLTFSKKEDRMRRRIDNFTKVIENIISTSTKKILLSNTMKNDIYLSLNYLYTIRNRSVHSIMESNSLLSAFDSLSFLINDSIIEHLSDFSSALYNSKTKHNQNFEKESQLLFVNAIEYKRRIYERIKKDGKSHNFAEVPFPFKEFIEYHII